MKASLTYRVVQIVVLLGFPVLGGLYVYQFSDPSREIVVPFKAFKAPQQLKYIQGGDLSGPQIPLPLKSVITVVNYWATWCPPCVEEFPAMIELKRRLAGKGVDIVFVSVNEKWEDVVEFQKKFRIDLPIEDNLWDSDKSRVGQWGSSKFPETYVIRKDGWVIEKIIGFQTWTRPAVVNYFFDLAEKFKNLPAMAAEFKLNWPSLISRAVAQETQLIHEKDRETLDKMRTNVETASKNLREVEGVLKEEKRNLGEQKVVLERRLDEESSLKNERESLAQKNKEAVDLAKRLLKSKEEEEREGKRIEARLKKIDEDILALKRALEKAETDRQQTQKSRDSSVQKLDVLQESIQSNDTETAALQGRVENANEKLRAAQKLSGEAKKELKKREDRLKVVESMGLKANRDLEEQRAKMEAFEKALQR